jgi:hypothetical protein
MKPGITHIIGDCLHRLLATGKALAVYTNIFVRDTRVIEVSPDNPVIRRIESPFNYVSNISLDLVRCELVSGLKLLSV